MKKLFSTTIDTLYSIATIIVLLMIIFPPVYVLHNGRSRFMGYEFVFDLSRISLIDLGRFSLQFIALCAFVFTIKRVVAKT